MFGNREGRGHGVTREPEPDSKWKGVERRTIPMEDATLWVFNEWVERNKLAERPIKNWEQHWKIWADEGADEELQIKREAETVAEMVSWLPVFVLKNLGTYYSGKMLMYATGTNAHATDVYRWLRDHRLKGRTEKEAGEAKRGSPPEPARPANMAALGPGGLAVVQLPPRGASLDRYLLGAMGYSEGAFEGSSYGGSELVSSLSEGFGELLVSERSSAAIADLIICAAIKHNLPIYESMERAVAQYEAVGGDLLGLHRTFIKLVADSADRTPARTPQIKPEEKFESADSERTETDGSKEEGPKEEYEVEGESWESADEGDVEIDLDKYSDIDYIDYCKGLLEEESGRDMGGPCPIPSLGEINKMWDHFSIPGEDVMLAPKYEHLDPDKAQESKNALWKFGVLLRFLPVTIPVIKPKNEVFFAEDLVRAAIPGVQQSGRSLAVAGLHVSFGAPVEATDTASSYQLQKMVHRFRQARERPAGFLNGVRGGGEKED
jgi:hypothetical protein